MVTFLAIVALVVVLGLFGVTVYMAMRGCFVSQISLVFNGDVWAKVVGTLVEAIFKGLSDS